MGESVFLEQVVAVIGRYQLNTRLAGNPDQTCVDRDLFLQTICLQFQEIMVGPEKIPEADRGLQGLLLLASQDKTGDLA